MAHVGMIFPSETCAFCVTGLRQLEKSAELQLISCWERKKKERIMTTNRA